MADEPTNGELGRQIESLRQTVMLGLAEVHRQMDGLVSAELYMTERETMKDKINQVQRGIEQDKAQLSGTRRWLAGLAVAFIISLIPYVSPYVGAES